MLARMINVCGTMKGAAGGWAWRYSASHPLVLLRLSPALEGRNSLREELRRGLKERQERICRGEYIVAEGGLGRRWDFWWGG